MASSKRELLLNTAQDLFYREGYHATGIDRILAESGVAKMTLYKHFKSKDELIMAALEERHARMVERVEVAERILAPRDAILAIFDGLQEVLKSPDFCGCAFIHAAGEFHDRDHPIHQQAAEHKAFLGRFFAAQLTRLGAAEPQTLARQLQYLLEGVLVMAHMQGPAQQGREARAMADTLLKHAGV